MPIFFFQSLGPVAPGLLTVPPPSLCLYVPSLSIELTKQFISGSGILVDKLNPKEVTDAVSAIQDGLARATSHTDYHTLACTATLPVPSPGFPFLPSQTMARDISLNVSCHTGTKPPLSGQKSYPDFHNSSLNSKSSHPLHCENWYFARGFCLVWMPRSNESFAKYSFFLNSQSFKMPWR